MKKKMFTVVWWYFRWPKWFDYRGYFHHEWCYLAGKIGSTGQYRNPLNNLTLILRFLCPPCKSWKYLKKSVLHENMLILINFSKRDCLYLGHWTYSALWLPFMLMPMPRKIEKMVNNTQTRATVANLLTNLTPKNTMVPRIITRKVPYTRKLLNFTEASLMSGPKRDICGPIT